MNWWQIVLLVIVVLVMFEWLKRAGRQARERAQTGAMFSKAMAEVNAEQDAKQAAEREEREKALAKISQ